MATDAHPRSLWYLHPVKSTTVQKGDKYLVRVGLADRRAGRLQPPTLPLERTVAPGATIEVAWEVIPNDGPPQCPRCGSTDFIQSPSAILCYRCGTKRPDRRTSPERRTTWFYAPTDSELKLMRQWGYDPDDPNWKRFAIELVKQSLMVGRPLPDDWRTKPAYKELTASELVNWMASLRGARAPKPATTKKPTRGGRKVVAKPPTEKQLRAVTLYGECDGCYTEVGRRMGISREAATQHVRAGLAKAGSAVLRTAKTKRLPTDRRGQQDVTEKDDRRR